MCTCVFIEKRKRDNKAFGPRTTENVIENVRFDMRQQTEHAREGLGRAVTGIVPKRP